MSQVIFLNFVSKKTRSQEIKYPNIKRKYIMIVKQAQLNRDLCNLVVLRDIYSEHSYVQRNHLICCAYCRLSRQNCLIQIVSDRNLADYLLTQRKLERCYKTTVSRERVASFLNFVPGDLEIT